MKKLKMLTSILVAIVLCLSFCMPTTVNAVTNEIADGAYPDDSTDCSITISNQVDGHKFVAYKIFKADLNVVGGVKTLSNIKFENESKADDMLAAINDAFERTGTTENNKQFTSAADVADYLSELTEGREEATVKFATAVNEYKGTGIDLTKNIAADQTVTYSVSGINPGYYLIIDENVDTVDPIGSIYSRFILQVAGNVTAEAKIEGQPVLDKVVGKMKNNVADYSAEDNMNNDSKHNTANVGDTIPFKLTINFPNLAEYSSYKFEVTDILSKGLTFDNNVTMKILNGTTVDSNPADMELVKDTDFTVATKAGGTTDDPTTEITIDFKTIFAKYTADKTLVGKTIVIEYTAELNENAKGNQEANKNTAKLTYSNDPRTSTSHGTTPDVTTETYTFNVTINKVDYKNKDAVWGNSSEGTLGNHIKTEGALSDVEFTLHRVTSAADATEETSVEIPGTYKTNANGQIELPGLANGTYYLVETVAHDGYNIVLGKIYFTISAKYDTESKKVELKDTDIDKSDMTPSDAKNEATLGIIPEFYETNPDVKFANANELYLLITNSQGAQLPSTGGVGTVIFTVVGILVMAAVVVIAVKSNKK